MANRLFVNVAAFLLVLLSCRADEAPDTERRTIHKFDKLTVSSAIKVTVTVNKDIKDSVMKITTVEKHLPSISAYVVPTISGGTLFLSAPLIPFARHGSTTRSVAIEVPEPLNWINANAGASIVVDKAAGDLSADGRGSVEVKEMLEPKPRIGAITSRTVVFRASSEGSLKVNSGELENAFVQASSAAEIDLSGLKIRHARIEASSSAKVTVQAVKTAALTCSSSAAVTIAGDADVSKLYTYGCSVTTGTADGKKNKIEDTTPLFP
eukprot:TRINITY_DN394_c0_g1_i2.p1 TRINITY_DN394_c0_g1~~TRINITY_DN394_c0_g1_i2.p1  ORF type:complete len:266 (-),score=57.09 TRINITY_DN394_c0_g1_i2:330-1127(-)